jgi:hypothetical protein
MFMGHPIDFGVLNGRLSKAERKQWMPRSFGGRPSIQISAQERLSFVA